MSNQEAVNQLQAFSLALQGMFAVLMAILLAQSSVQFGAVLVGLHFFPVVALVFWPARASYSWTIFFLFLAGLFHDLVSNGPFGIWSLSYMLAYMILGGGVPIKSRFSSVCLWFLMCLFIVVLVSFFAGDVIFGAVFPNLFQTCVEIATIIILFPLVYFGLIVVGIRQPAAFASKGR